MRALLDISLVSGGTGRRKLNVCGENLAVEPQILAKAPDTATGALSCRDEANGQTTPTQPLCYGDGFPRCSSRMESSTGQNAGRRLLLKPCLMKPFSLHRPERRGSLTGISGTAKIGTPPPEA